MARKVVTSESHIGSEGHVSKPNPATSALDKPGDDEDSHIASRRHCPPWIQQLKQGVADYEHFVQWINLDPSIVYNTIVSAQAEYEKLQQQTMEQHNKALEAHRARALIDDHKAAEAEDAEWGTLKTQDRFTKGKNDRLRLDGPTRAGSGVLASVDPADRENSDESTLSAWSVAGPIEPIEPRTSKSTYIPDPERLDDGITPQFESWLNDMEGKFFFNADHYPTEKHKIIYIACRTTGTAHEYLNARLRKDAVTPYTTAQQVFDDLEWRFGSLKAAAEACDGLDRPNMKPTDDFHTFLHMFLYKSGGNRTSFGCLKNELFDCLTEDLKRAVQSAVCSDSVTFDEFTKLCAYEAGLLANGYNKNRKRGGRKGKKNAYRDNNRPFNTPALQSSPAPGNDEWKISQAPTETWWDGGSVSPDDDKWADNAPPSDDKWKDNVPPSNDNWVSSVSTGNDEWPRESASTDPNFWPRHSGWPQNSSCAVAGW
jgi:hypothetical protein